MTKRYYSYDEFIRDCKIILPKLKKYNPEALIAIARGGVTFGHLIASALKTNNFFTINSIHYEENKKLNNFKISNIPNLDGYNKVLIVDDIVDSGETMTEIKKILNTKYPKIEFKTVSLFYKEDALIIPDVSVNKTKDWIEFFWEVDLK